MRFVPLCWFWRVDGKIVYYNSIQNMVLSYSKSQLLRDGNYFYFVRFHRKLMLKG